MVDYRDHYEEQEEHLEDQEEHLEDQEEHLECSLKKRIVGH